MRITKPEKFPIEFEVEEAEVFEETIFMLGKIIHTLEENDFTVLQNSLEGNCIEIKDIARIRDVLMDLAEMDTAF